MDYHLTLAPDITIKSRSVRRHLTKCLARNVRNTLRRSEPQAVVLNQWDQLIVRLPQTLSAGLREILEKSMTRIPGIHRISRVRMSEFGDLNALIEEVADEWAPRISGNSFRVSVKRSGQHDFRSVDLERRLGAVLLERANDARVSLTAAQVDVRLRIDQQIVMQEDTSWPGAGGFPIGTQGQALVLMSGGFDSPVAAWKMMRRGIKCHFLLFRFAGEDQERAVRAITLRLWQLHGASHNITFTTVPFEDVIDTIRRDVPDGLMGVVLKRLMMRAAERVAIRARLPVLVTGEAIGQVSSQTLANLSLIDGACRLPILRPLLTDDKQDIIDIARHIETAELSEVMPEYCAVISRKPHVKAPWPLVEAAEAALPEDLLDRAIANLHRCAVDAPMEPDDAQGSTEIDTISFAKLHELSEPRPQVIDIRAPDQAETNPLQLDDWDIRHIPFYELASQGSQLDPQGSYVLYCDQGIMSRLQALHLKSQGFDHVAVLSSKPNQA
uniref:tRNA uracil 4-sulfurtransferase ThiI n=1 Tax=Halomonas sp. TaxID=1486246 RepID=UPI002623A215|nr:tRNA uracil 4-sulfurtransferase ThiI [Halomonas sp.]